MTVCIAAIATWGGSTVIVGAADRLVTWGDIEYEQPGPKILQLASHTVLLMAGNPEHHTAIVNRVWGRLRALQSPSVETIAQVYAQEFANFRRETNERKYLTPLGLLPWNLTNQSSNLPPALLDRLSTQMDSELNCEALICGVDQAGAHVFVVEDPGVCTCHDLAGWAAVGGGWRHANAQFIAARYSRFVSFDQAFLMTYIAKKRADVTPGVGQYTDMFWIAQKGYNLLAPDHDLVKFVTGLHGRMVKSDEKIKNDSLKKVSEFVRNSVAQQQPPERITVRQTAAIDAPEISAAQGHERDGQGETLDGVEASEPQG